ncbi:MAG: hypothetical protein REI93_07110, partial [Pedobacter sp.]|nr:hypothetical protein [Pedobacter sp.]
FSEDGRTLFFNSFDITGYEVAKIPVIEKPIQTNHFVYFGQAATEQENTGNVFDQVPDSSFSSTPYHPFAHLFNIHSISFATDDDDQLSLRLKSNDLLNIFDAYAGIGYDQDLRKVQYQAGLSFKSLYPVFTSEFKNRARQAYYRLGGNLYRADWRENYINLKASLPLSFNKFQHNYSLLGEMGTSYTKRNFAPAEAKLFNQTVRFPMSYKLGFSHRVRTAERDVAPRWAQSLSFSYNNQPFDKSLKGDLMAFESAFYFPGLAKNHSMQASFNYQQASGLFNFSNEIATVWGYGQVLARSELRNTLLLNYRFPILFPDAEIGSLAYIRNIRGGFFSHYENIGAETNLTQPKTFGLELRSSMNLLRYQPIVDLGARLIFVNKVYHQNPILEFTFNYSF